MSCFIVPMVQAAALTVYRRHCRRSQKDNHAPSVWTDSLPSLEKMLWGGTLMLVIDHILNSEFLMSPKEMLTVGLPMSVAVTAVWALAVRIKGRRAGRQSL